MTRIARFKKRFYFNAAKYFRFFANISLKRWKPRIIAITGSAGKTTMLHLVEFELGKKAHYSHNANSAFGVSFDILGLKGVRGSKLHWIILFLATPIKALFYTHKEKFYVVEIDGERPHETEFLATWLKPEVTVWVSIGRSHAIQFESIVSDGKFDTLDDAITAEFANLPKNTKKLVLIDADEKLMVNSTKNIEASVESFNKSDIKKYIVYPDSTDFSAGRTTFHFSQPQPRDISIQLLMLRRLCEYLKINLKTDFTGMPVPPGRSSFFQGKNGLKIIDSSYNAHIISMESILEMAKSLHAPHKWLIIGDIVEQGSIEKEEHEKLADLIAGVDAEEIILVGRRTKQYTAPKLKELGLSPKTTLDPKKALEYIEKKTHGRETLIFKGSQYLEWIIEQLLENPEDAKLLPRRERAAIKRRKKRGLK
ncbi:hypothetical protein IKG45_01355 [Candidatus Saccharibacteria bacterium]|nr:hypothetical protein [Candidatus Saccharibacteria bacterium]